MPAGRHLTQDFQQKIVGAYKKGISQKEISRNFSLHKSVVSKVLKRYRTKGNIILLKRRGGRYSKTSEHLDRRIQRVAKANPKLSGKGILNELGINEISYKTI